VRDDVRADPFPGRDLRRDALRLAVLAEVRAPGKAQDHDVDGIAHRRHAEFSEAVESKRADVAGRIAVDRDDLVSRGPQLVERVREIHVEQPGRVLEASEVLLQTEDGRALGRVVAANALEHA
jgi:hypothetical protein